MESQCGENTISKSQKTIRLDRYSFITIPEDMNPEDIILDIEGALEDNNE